MRTVFDLFACQKKVDGDLGIEVEVEGKGLPKIISRNWRVDKDGSLRGESCEYVFAKPLTPPQAAAALNELAEAYKLHKSVVEDSFRAGIHVHVNCQALSIIELYNYVTLYLVFEELFVKWCGEGRTGNLFCLRSSDADWLLNVIINNIKKLNIGRLDMPAYDENVRYSSMNLCALHKYGSLEFRAMRSTTDINRIYAWAMTLLYLREKAKEFDSPQEIMYEFSLNGREAFINNMLGDMADVFKRASVDYMGDVVNGIRNAQEIAFVGNWDKIKEFAEKEMVEEPKRANVKVAFDPELMRQVFGHNQEVINRPVAIDNGAVPPPLEADQHDAIPDNVRGRF